MSRYIGAEMSSEHWEDKEFDENNEIFAERFTNWGVVSWRANSRADEKNNCQQVDDLNEDTYEIGHGGDESEQVVAYAFAALQVEKRSAKHYRVDEHEEIEADADDENVGEEYSRAVSEREDESGDRVASDRGHVKQAVVEEDSENGKETREVLAKHKVAANVAELVSQVDDHLSALKYAD